MVITSSRHFHGYFSSQTFPPSASHRFSFMITSYKLTIDLFRVMLMPMCFELYTNAPFSMYLIQLSNFFLHLHVFLCSLWDAFLYAGPHGRRGEKNCNIYTFINVWCNSCTPLTDEGKNITHDEFLTIHKFNKLSAKELEFFLFFFFGSVQGSAQLCMKTFEKDHFIIPFVRN